MTIQKDDAYGQAIERVLFSKTEIAAAIDRLAVRIASDYSGQPLLLLGVLKGALYVTVDLARAISRLPDGPSSIEVEYLAVSSYGNAVRSSGEVRLLKDTNENITAKHVLVVEDIVDNGLTLQYLRSLVGGRNPASLAACVLFDKPYHRSVDVPLEYVGLVAPDTFVVGYGLDYQEKYRNLPYLAQLRSFVFSEDKVVIKTS
ncbi:MAG TPA: hypoxanthine phosphoribosyltransferase [Candidatus Baltobacteraceae bacterium]